MARHPLQFFRDEGDAVLEQTIVALAGKYTLERTKVAETLQLLLRTFPSVRIRRDECNDSCTSRIETTGYIGRIVDAAFHSLGTDHALELFETTPGQLLEERIWVISYLAGTWDEDGVPLYSCEQLADELSKFRDYLERDRRHLLETGLPSQEFDGSRWLASKLTRLYPVHRADTSGPFDPPIEIAGSLTHYKWLKVVPNPSGGQVIRSICPQEQAELIAGLVPSDAVKLSAIRGKILDFKLGVLTELNEVLRVPSGQNAWNCCQKLLHNELTCDEAEFCRRMDQVYQLVPAESVGKSVAIARAFGYDGPLQPGGLGDVLELVGHVEKEIMFGTMHHAYEVLEPFIFDDDGRPTFLPNASSYFELIAATEQEVIDNAISIFVANDRLERNFWHMFHERVLESLAALDQKVLVEMRADNACAADLRKYVATYADFAKKGWELTGKLPLPFLIAADSSRVAGLVESPGDAATNVFQGRDGTWEIRFGANQRFFERGRDGLTYIQILLMNPGRSFTAFQLYAEKPVPETQNRSIQRPEALCSTGLVTDGAPSAVEFASEPDKVFTTERLGTYERRLAEIKEERAKASRNNDESQLNKLDHEEQLLNEEIANLLGPQARRLFQSASKRAYDRVNNAIERAKNAIKKKDEKLYDHLIKSIVYNGFFKYSPSEEITWNDI